VPFVLDFGPVHRPIAASTTAFWGIGTYFGSARSQNAQGHLLGHVYDLGKGLSATNPNLRSYATAERQNFHIDRCDVVALLCLKRAKSGGLSSIVSSMAVHNVMAARRPDLLDRLYRPFPVDRRGEVPEGKARFYEAPVFNKHEGYVSVLYSRLHIGSSQRFPEARRLTAEDIEALDMLAELAADPELRLDMNFTPGDIQFLHNHTILHARSAYATARSHGRPAPRRATGPVSVRPSATGSPHGQCRRYRARSPAPPFPQFRSRRSQTVTSGKSTQSHAPAYLRRAKQMGPRSADATVGGAPTECHLLRERTSGSPLCLSSTGRIAGQLSGCALHHSMDRARGRGILPRAATAR
jgi:hypothetical protein